MGLNISKGNMYPWITHTWNTIKGACPHDCSYCYMKRWGKLKPVRFDEKELKTDLGKGNFIFVGSSCDMFANKIPTKWIIKILEYCSGFNNSYLFQSKNPKRMIEFDVFMPNKSVICTTIETNKWYPEIMKNSPKPIDRATIHSLFPFDRYVTIEPIIEFNLDKLIELIKIYNPTQVNIGADTGNNNLPEPKSEKILDLINELEKFTIVKKKQNLKRLTNG